jgi:hypothetical protein
MFRAAAFLAAAGTALVSLMYLINNVLPILTNLKLVPPREAAVVFLNTIVPSLLWTVLFWSCGRARGPRPAPGIAWAVLALAVAFPLLYQAYRQLPYFSVLALDSISFLVSGVLLPLAWGVILAAMARARAPQGMALIALILTAVSAAPEAIGAVGVLRDAAGGTLAAFGDADPAAAFWRLIATPVIRLFYWLTQLLFLAALRKA